MKKLLASVLLALLSIPAFAHRLDEYLQATILSIGSGRVEASMRLVPGVAVSSAVIARIDTDRDGTFSASEQQAYAQAVLNDLLLKVDGRPLTPHLVSIAFPSIDQIGAGTGEIQLTFTADLPSRTGPRTLTFENHHDSAISVYLVNSLISQDSVIQLAGQTRNINQSFYQLDFTQGPAARSSVLPGISGFAGAFRLGLRHIAEGTDHLMFLLALLLPAPLLAASGRWRDRATVRQSLLQILRIVTAFTLGHSLTLACAAFGLLRLPSRPVEVLIAVSILVSAIHAIRPLFPGREALIAAGFGLIHGLAFASALTQLGFTGWYRLLSLFGFNFGIETMQLVVVAAILPSLLLLSRTRAYSFFRVAGALFAASASSAWILERSFNLFNPIDTLVEDTAHHALWIAALLFVVSLLLSRLPRHDGEPASTLQPDF